MRIVLDTNIYIAAAQSSGLAKKVLDVIFENKSLTLVTSIEILQELSDKLLHKFHWIKEKVNSYLKDIIIISQRVRPNEKLYIVSRDPNDNKILECAVAGDADIIVTLDQDLIKLKKFRNIAIVHPKTFTYLFPELFEN